ncbi:conserved exported hypothetical protein [anaerobic digester metagenome]|uniref:Peptidase M14 domain-containing protein n=1 Tax=anaerobic digester metagenome TaxID=1263854 RepID=A0A485LV81_9ZZZZ
MRKTWRGLMVILLILNLSLGSASLALAQDDGSTPYNLYTGDPYTKDPRELITQEYFGNEWVNTIPSKGKVPSPYDYFGYLPGSPLRLTPYTEMYEYYSALARSSNSVAMINIGESSGGLPMYIVAISSPDTIARLDQYQQNLNKLADPRLLGFPANEKAADAAAEKMIAKASEVKPIYWIWGKIHSTEVGAGEMLMEFAHRLAVDDRDMFKKIRDNLIVFITDPNPDGTEMVNTWVNRYDKEYGGSSSPPFYNNYTQHDNNRDTHTNSQPEQLNLVKAYNEWPAQVVLDIHQSMFLLFTFSGMEPTLPGIDPLTQTEWQWLAARELNQAQQFNMPGVWEYKYVNMYYPMYQLQMAHLRNGTGKFYEVFGSASSSTKTSAVSSGNRTWYWYSPKPYDKEKIIWSLRNNVNYSQTAALTTALEIANNRETILKNYWVKAKNAVSAPGRTEIGSTGNITYPYGYVIPAVQKDMPDTVLMIQNLLDNGLEIGKANTGFQVEGKSYPAGSYILKMNQPFSRLAFALFERFAWPTGSPPPYDATAWQYDLMRDVKVDRIDDPDILSINAPLITDVALTGTTSGEISAGYYVIDHNSINNIVTLAFALAENNFNLFIAKEADNGVIDAGDLVIPAEQEGVYELLTDLVEELGLTMHSVSDEVAVELHKFNAPRVAMFHAWNGVQTGGWSRFTFEQYGVPYTIIQNADVLAGNLKGKYDVIFLPDLAYRSFVNGVSGNIPRVVDYGPVQTENRLGGLGTAGIAALKAFVDAGGMLICNNQSSGLPIQYNFIEGVSTVSGFNAPGPILNIKPDLSHPIAYGAEETMYFYSAGGSPVFNAPEETVVASFPAASNDVFVTGFLEGANIIAGKAAIVDAPAKDGTGRVILFGTDITYRWQAFGSYFYLWNAILNWDDLTTDGIAPNALKETGPVLEEPAEGDLEDEALEQEEPAEGELEQEEEIGEIEEPGESGEVEELEEITDDIEVVS